MLRCLTVPVLGGRDRLGTQGLGGADRPAGNNQKGPFLSELTLFIDRTRRETPFSICKELFTQKPFSLPVLYAQL